MWDAIAITPDGTLFAIVGTDRRVRIFSTSQRNKKPMMYMVHDWFVSDLCFTPDGKHLLTASDEVLRIWTMDTGVIEYELYGHHHYIKVVRITPNGTYAVTGSDDGQVRVWHLGQRKCLYIHDNSNMFTLFTILGNTHFIGVYQDKVLVKDIVTGAVCLPLQDHSQVITSICTTAGYIVIGYINGTVRIYNDTNGHYMHELEAHVRGILSMSANNGLLATTSGSRNVRVWDLASGKLRYEWASKFIDIVCLSRLGEMVVVGMKNGSVHKFWINKRKAWVSKKCCFW